MNSFGKEQLLKYGWTIGKGLGAEENGITDTIKPKLKFCTAGLGHNIAEEFTFHWWDHVYNKAAQNLKVKKKQNGRIEIVKQKDLIICTKKPSTFKTQNGTGLYNYFVKGNILNAPEETNKDESDSESEDDDDRKDFSSNLTDDQLFQICGGMTAHKGARHGLKMSAKLARLEQQEKGGQIKSLHHSPEISAKLPSILFCTEKQEKSLQFDTPPSSPKVMSYLKPILKESTPDNSNLKKRKSVQFNEDLKLKIFSYCAQNCDKEADISIKMEDDETPSSTLAVYVEEFSIENNISTDTVNSGVKKKKKVKKNVLHTGEDFRELLGPSLQQETNNINNNLIDPKTNALTLEADTLESVEQKENNENFEKMKKKKKKKSYDNVSNEQIVDTNYLQPTEPEVLDVTKCKKKKKRKTEVIYCEKDAKVFDLYDNSSAQTQTILHSELMKKKRKKKKIELDCSNDTLDISTSSHIVILDGSFSSKDNVEGKLKKQSTTENAVEQLNLEEVTSDKKKKRKRKLEDDDVTLELTNTQSFSKKKKKYLNEGS